MENSSKSMTGMEDVWEFKARQSRVLLFTADNVTLCEKIFHNLQYFHKEASTNQVVVDVCKA